MFHFGCYQSQQLDRSHHIYNIMYAIFEFDLDHTVDHNKPQQEIVLLVLVLEVLAYAALTLV